MENPASTVVAAVKSNLNVSTIIKTVVGLLFVFAILDAAGLTSWILQPVSSAKAKFGKRTE